MQDALWLHAWRLFTFTATVLWWPGAAAEAAADSRCHVVLVRGIGGLGNTLFQVASAVYYAEKYGYRIVLDAASRKVHWGTANINGRKSARKVQGVQQSYTLTIFNSSRLSVEPVGPLLARPGCRMVPVNNLYTANVFTPGPDDANATLEIQNYSQNKALFLPILSRLPDYLNLDDPFSAAILRTRYGLKCRAAYTLLIGMRQGLDWQHIKKVNAGSYERALDVVFPASGPGVAWTVVIVADTNVKAMRLPQRVSKVAQQAGQRVAKTVVIQEDDITQLHAGLCCTHFIICDSTFHYWMAAIRTAWPPDQPAVVVTVFNDTDLTNRPMAFDTWKRVLY